MRRSALGSPLFAVLALAGCPEEEHFGSAGDDDSAEETPSPWVEGELLARDSHANWTGGAPGDELGGNIVVLPDITGDGLSELLFGTPERGPASEGGACIVFSGQARVPGAHNCADANVNVVSNLPDARLGASAVWMDMDLDEDGLGELVLGAPGHAGVGAFYVVPSSALIAEGTVVVDPLWAVAGTEDAGDFGASLATVADQDGDGDAELLVGAPAVEAGGEGSGRLYAFLSTVFPTGEGADASWATVLVDGDQDGMHLGQALSSVGDLDGDGQDEVAAPVPDFDGSGVDSGGVLLFRGPSLFSSPVNLDAADAWVTLEGPNASERAGIAVASAGDTEGDGLGDLWVGAPLADWTEADAGGAYLVRGSSLGAGGTRNLGFAYARIAGGAAGDHFGTAIAGGRDMDGDGVPDHAFGAPLVSLPVQEGGVVAIWSGASLAAGGELAAADATLRIAPEYATQQIGRSLAFVPDLDGDTRSELLIGAPDHREGSNPSPAGRVFLVLSP